MNRQRLVQDLEATVGMAVGVVISEQTSDLIKHWFPTPGTTAAFAIIIVTLSVILAKFIAGNLFIRSRALRRILLGKQYVEGVWFDIMRKDNEPVEIGFSRLSYTNSEIEFCGEDYDLAMDQRFPYRAEMVQMDWPTFRYVYSAHRSDTKEEQTTGYGRLLFQERHRGCPRKYSGKYFVLRGTDTISFEGIKLNEKQDRALIELLEEPETVRQALRELLVKYGNSRFSEGVKARWAGQLEYCGSDR